MIESFTVVVETCRNSNPFVGSDFLEDCCKKDREL